LVKDTIGSHLNNKIGNLIAEKVLFFSWLVYLVKENIKGVEHKLIVEITLIFFIK